MRKVESIIGTIDDPTLGERVHRLEHAGKVEYITLARADMSRRRQRAVSDKGGEYAIALPRDQRLTNGAILWLDEERAVVVRLEEQKWLTLAPADVSIALQLGYQAGNMHWRVQFAGDRLRIAVDGDEAAYLARLKPLLATDRLKPIDDR